MVIGPALEDLCLTLAIIRDILSWLQPRLRRRQAVAARRLLGHSLPSNVLVDGRIG
jgi:hypothetical protein